MRNVLAALDHALRWALIVLMVGLVLAVTWQVISRYLFASPSSWTEEIARFLLIWIGTLGAAYAFRLNAHIGLDLLPKKLTGAAAQRLHWFTQCVIIVFAVAVLVIGGSRLVYLTWDLRQYSAVLGLPIAVVYSIIPVTGVLVVIYALAAFPHMPDADASLEVD
jgi:TRAP-type C4-dicarboxylate transport system permease small subunit